MALLGHISSIFKRPCSNRVRWSLLPNICSGVFREHLEESTRAHHSSFYSSLATALDLTEDTVEINSEQGKLSLLNVWLRDHCRCSDCFHPLTRQRQIDTFQIPLNIKPVEAKIDENKLLLKWPDSHRSSFDIDWLLKQHRIGAYTAFDFKSVRKVYWGEEISRNLPEDIKFEDALNEEEGLNALFNRILQYGFAFVSNTPLENEAFQKLLSKLGIGKNTLFGESFEFTSNVVDHLDTAYLSIALGAHTDGTYFFDSPGLQVFHCKYHDGEGGENLFVDGINAALQLKYKHPDAFQFLSTTCLPAVYADGDHLFKNFSPMINIDPSTGLIYQVRVNNDDRDVLTTLNTEEIKNFYRYLKQYYTILRSAENSYWIKLTPGRAIIVDNWRVLHGRAAFTGKRTIFGCYIQREDFISRARARVEQ